MVDTHRILPAYTLHRENAQIFLNPCHHILHSIICLELRGTYPTYGRSSSSIDFVQQSPLWTAQCRRCCTKRSLNFQVLWIIVPNKLFFKLFDSSPKPSSDFCHVIFYLNAAQVYSYQDFSSKILNEMEDGIEKEKFCCDFGDNSKIYRFLDNYFISCTNYNDITDEFLKNANSSYGYQKKLN